LQSFVADTEPEQQLAYEDLEQIEKLDLEEIDLKWQMAMLSVRVQKFEQKARRKIDFDKKESFRFNKKKVYKVVKALYRLHQAPRAWYATLSTFLLKHGYRRGTIDKTLFLKKNNRDIILVQVYVDDIIFKSTMKAWCDEFEALMKGEFQMSAMGELTFFLGLQVQQIPDGIFIHQDKYVQEILNKFDLGSVRTATTPYEAPKPKSKNKSDSPVNVPHPMPAPDQSP
nr:putative ribonuclease H-like domain-containing protein [Tanacetum cinerariifolium]